MQEWFKSHGIKVMEYPTYSPDLNLIEHYWNLLKKQLVLLYPNLFINRRAQVNWRQFKRAIRTAWWSIPQAKINSLINSMPQRVEEAYQAQGWYTRY
jgi:transposase